VNRRRTVPGGTRGARAFALPALLAAFAAFGQDLQPVPEVARVTDLTGTLTADQQAALEEKLRAFEARKGAQLAVLIVPTTEPEAIEQYGIRVAEAWQLGREKVDDGAILIVAKDDREMRIEVGYGLEGALPDATANRIIEDTIAPLFRHGDYYGGINAGLDQMTRVIDGEPLPEPDQRWQGRPDFFGMLPVLLMVVLIGSSILRAIFGRALGATLTGGGVGLLAFLLSQALGIALFAGVIAFVFALVSGFGRNVWSSHPRYGGWGGGWTGGGWGGGFGGGGGFSGGGFGGGGASGRW
jgi:uncharacterized protein